MPAFDSLTAVRGQIEERDYDAALQSLTDEHRAAHKRRDSSRLRVIEQLAWLINEEATAPTTKTAAAGLGDNVHESALYAERHPGEATASDKQSLGVLVIAGGLVVGLPISVFCFALGAPEDLVGQIFAAGFFLGLFVLAPVLVGINLILGR